MRVKKARCARLFLSLAGALLCLSCLPAHTSPLPPGTSRYVAIIDAGSGGSRVYLYKATRSKESSEAQDLMEYESKAPGLSSFQPNPVEAGEKGVAPLLARLSDYLAAQHIDKADVEVDVLATAGMRLLDNGAQRAIFDSVRRSVAERAFAIGDIETIPGAMEGIYSWVDVNFLLGRFSDGQTSVGVVEIGGASAQIAFETHGPHAGGQGVSIGSRTYDVFVTSFLGLGRNEARRRMIEIFDRASGAGGNPCYPRGIVATDEAAVARAVAGDFNYAACVRTYADLLGKYDLKRVRLALQTGAGSFAAIGTGNPIGTFWGLLEAWKTGSSNPFDILAKEKAGCDRPWSAFQAEYGGGAFNETQCADSTFVTSFLYGEEGLRLNGDAVRSYKSIDGKTPTWTRGVIVLKYLN
jgi:GDA1/CD39 (nucleoside phosphatase) family